MMKEAKIIINGIPITDSMVMTIRVAIEGFASDLLEYGLGDDDHGKEMVYLYLSRIEELRHVMKKN